MSKHKFAVPQTYVLYSSPKLDELHHRVHGIRMPLMTAAGKPVGSKPLLAQPLFNEPQPLGFVSQWINEAARRRNNGIMADAKPGELVQVPIFRGIPCSLATQYRAQNRKEARESRLAQVKAALAARAAEASRNVQEAPVG